MSADSYNRLAGLFNNFLMPMNLQVENLENIEREMERRAYGCNYSHDHGAEDNLTVVMRDTNLPFLTLAGRKHFRNKILPNI
ncbi:hypothetical protein LTR62_003444 [Meristemomyces frigidus]|uniref:Uncharacterized protein n=1 Tax=Meristemomyces frigidus TaxID=1508187 RepID=A0AAN7YGW1_9PEZI|nr:hypothetical protein LTR62_003444 [Meristemomyces frigidus]